MALCQVSFRPSRGLISHGWLVRIAFILGFFHIVAALGLVVLSFSTSGDALRLHRWIEYAASFLCLIVGISIIHHRSCSSLVLTFINAVYQCLCAYFLWFFYKLIAAVSVDSICLHNSKEDCEVHLNLLQKTIPIMCSINITATILSLWIIVLSMSHCSSSSNGLDDTEAFDSTSAQIHQPEDIENCNDCDLATVISPVIITLRDEGQQLGRQWNNDRLTILVWLKMQIERLGHFLWRVFDITFFLIQCSAVVWMLMLHNAHHGIILLYNISSAGGMMLETMQSSTSNLVKTLFSNLGLRKRLPAWICLILLDWVRIVQVLTFLLM